MYEFTFNYQQFAIYSLPVYIYHILTKFSFTCIQYRISCPCAYQKFHFFPQPQGFSWGRNPRFPSIVIFSVNSL